MSDRVVRRREIIAVGTMLLSSLLGGCGEIASPDRAPVEGRNASAQMSIEEVIAAILVATPNPVTPEAAAETFVFGANATDIQREMKKQELVGSVVEWDVDHHGSVALGLGSSERAKWRRGSQLGLLCPRLWS